MSDRQSPATYNSPNNSTLISTGPAANSGIGGQPGAGYIYLQQQQQQQAPQQQQLCYQSLSGNFINGGNGQSLLYSTAGNGAGHTVQSQFYSQYHPSAAAQLQYQHHSNVISVGGSGGMHHHHQQHHQYSSNKKGTLRNNADGMKRTRTQNA